MATKAKSDISRVLKEVEEEIGKVVVGQENIIHGFLRGILCNGHVLVEGVPGVAKTLIVKTMAKVLGCEMKRIQFTVDLLPTDITGIMSYDPKKGFEVLKGPVFANFVFAVKRAETFFTNQGNIGKHIFLNMVGEHDVQISV